MSLRVSLLAPLCILSGFTLVGAVACSSTTVVQPAAATDSGASSGSTSGEEEDSGASSSGTSSGEEDSGLPVPAGPMTLESDEYEDGATYPMKYTCNGDETKSPPLKWTPGKEGTLSYAIIFYDSKLKFYHSAIYDIPATTLELPEGVEAKYQPKVPAGAKQATNYKGKLGYVGPCPPKPGEDVYEFKLYALKVAKLTGLTQASEAEDVETAAKKQQLEMTVLSAKYKQP